MRQNARLPMPMLLSIANSRRRRMIEFASVLNTLATAMAVVMAMKQLMNSWMVSYMTRAWRSFSALLLRYVRYHSVPLRSLSIIASISASIERGCSAAKER